MHAGRPILGWHWVGTLRGCRPDAALVGRALREVPDALGLKRLGEPIVQMTAEAGIVGIVLLSTSHASVHVPGDGDDCLCDVFSCAPFDADACAAGFSDLFQPVTVEATVLARS